MSWPILAVTEPGSARAADAASQRFGPAATPALLVGLLVLFVALGERMLADPDTQWHPAIGRWIWETGSFPRADHWSYTFAGSPWVAKEWLSQFILFGAQAAAGWPGVAILSACVVAGSFTLLFEVLRRRLRPTLALAMVLIALLLTAPHILARPHLLTFPVLIAWTAVLIAARERGEAPPWWLPLLMVLWANLHAGYAIGLAVAGLLALEALVEAPPAQRRAVAGRWATVVGASTLAVLATPYGFDTLLVTAKLFGSGEPLPYIGEWQPLSLNLTGIVAVASLVVLMAMLLAHGRRNLARIAILALVGLMMLRHSRFIDMFALIAPLVCAGPLARRFGASGAQTPFRHWRATLATGLGIAALGLAVPARPSVRAAPEAALDAARSQGLTTGRVLNDYDFGGFLIAQSVPTFIDGRTDQLFLGGFISDAMKAGQARDPSALSSLIGRHGVTWALVRTGSGEARHLAALPGWSLRHEDPVAQVYARP